MRKLLFCLLMLGGIVGAVNSQNYSSELTSKTDFDNFSSVPLTNKYGKVKSVKVVYDLNNKEIFYLDANIFKDHFSFCFKNLNYKSGIVKFLKENYSVENNRKFLLANLNYFDSNQKFVIDISPIDLMGKEHLELLYSSIKESAFMKDELLFLLNSPRLNDLKNELFKTIKTISPSEIYGDLNYQAISKYSTKGILRVVKDSIDMESTFNKTDILVLKFIPGYLPPVSGIIVTEFQTPLSHISILGINRKIPVCAYTKAFENNSLMELDGSQIFFKVSADTFYVEKDSSQLQLEIDQSIDVSLNLKVDTLIDVKYLNKNSFDYVGSKAANFGELYQLSKSADFKTPECAFAIPFYFYQEHMKKSGALKLIRKINRNPLKSQRSKMKLLKRIRTRILKENISKKTLELVYKKISSSEKFSSFRFRSSTNVEDLKGFSGAGLYSSKTGKLNSKKKSVENAIKIVWSSNWSDKAYFERSYFNIDQNNVAMGILVHRSFPNEKVNGVALTKNIFRRNSKAFYINAQLGNENVVNPKKGVVCDQFLCLPNSANKNYENQNVIDVITYSNINNNQLVMSRDEIQHLANQLEIIKRHFAGGISDWFYTRKGYDIEFKLDGEDRLLYIKQIRPYNE